MNVTDRKKTTVKIVRNLFQSSLPILDNATAILFCLYIIPFFKVLRFFVFTFHRKCFAYFNGLLQRSKLLQQGEFKYKISDIEDFGNQTIEMLCSLQTSLAF